MTSDPNAWSGKATHVAVLLLGTISRGAAIASLLEPIYLLSMIPGAPTSLLIRFAIAAGAILALVACENRIPLNRAIVVNIADSFMLREGFDWGTPVEVLAPDGRSLDGRRWWQIRYEPWPEPDGRERIIIVDDASGWARLPPDNYRRRIDDSSARVMSEYRSRPTGDFVLMVTGDHLYSKDRRSELDREVLRLNELAKTTGVVPLFSVRQDRGEGLQIVYGWQGDHGIVRDETIRDWLRLRTKYDSSNWVELAK